MTLLVKALHSLDVVAICSLCLGRPQLSLPLSWLTGTPRFASSDFSALPPWLAVLGLVGLLSQ
jgi:hypothetical protein